MRFVVRASQLMAVVTLVLMLGAGVFTQTAAERNHRHGQLAGPSAAPTAGGGVTSLPNTGAGAWKAAMVRP